ncbi:tyrosine-protein kinase hopscotch [Nylanderia fulva]|uniref:tyrosine-protein kinase hopscotch n=1 Tax=Nylanderia fulva TaxID=613905 RepID=UPI0010FB02D7|nr:tyrosine-protein kinase hopscotch [Nylanderia fulva]
MKDERSAVIYVATDDKQINITFFVGATIEDLCIQICKRFKIGPVARHLFALRSYSSKLWFPYGHKLEDRDKNRFDFRLRFKPCSMQKLKQIDEHAYNYYFQQVRIDIMNNKVPDIVYEKHKDKLIGLGVSDMYRVMLEKQLPREIIESEYKKYIPKECIKRHAFFVKKPIYNALAEISGEHLDASYVKEQYLQQFESMAPNYLYEEYKALMDKGVPNPPAKVLLRINREEIKYCETDTDDWKTLCTIGDLCFISIREDNTVEISRKNGIPSYLKFMGHTNGMLMSFVSALDGYYRLSIKWTFNLCRDVTTPTLDRLHDLKCHGPVGKQFSYAKLKEKRTNKPGTYILRESETEFDVYYIDVCNRDEKVISQRVEQIPSGEFSIFSQKYPSLMDLISSFQDRDNPMYLEECLRPSEYDISPLLICASENIASEQAADEEIIALLEGGPRCVSQNQLCKSGKDLSRMSVMSVQRATWRIAEGKKLEIMMKTLKPDYTSYTKDFLELADKWGKLRSGALIRLYGITVAPSIGMLLELVKLGPLDLYLRTNSSTIKIVDMVEATACLTTALWHLEENHVVHGKIRCSGVFVHAHTNSNFSVKLGDPGLFTYTDNDIPWIPPECYADLRSAKYSFQADIWALATTIWEIFSRGISIPIYHTDIVKKFYGGFNHLPQPMDCPYEVYHLMCQCWNEKSTRKQPQAIMRDINQIMYQVYNSRRNHAYATAFPKFFNTDENDSNDDLEERTSNSESQVLDSCSLNTDHTNLTWDDNDTVISSQENSVVTNDECFRYLNAVIRAMNDAHMSSINGTSHRGGNNEIYLGQMKDIFENETNSTWTIYMQERIGQGFYGDVYRGTRIKGNEIEQIAIKKLKIGTQSVQNDFEREIQIMKTLKHRNIVKILGNISEPKCLIMEFVEHGSLATYLQSNRKTLRSPKKLLHFALDIATGMDYLGSKNVVHRDVATRNVLVVSETHVKISDFGLAQMTKGKGDYYMLQTVRDLPMKWYAPESLKEFKFSSRSDVWSFGVTMYEIFSLGEDPKLPEIELNYKNITEKYNIQERNMVTLVAAFEKGIRLPCPELCPPEVYQRLMHSCWNMKSHERPTFATLCKDINELLQKYIN